MQNYQIINLIFSLELDCPGVPLKMKEVLDSPALVNVRAGAQAGVGGGEGSVGWRG